MKQLASNQEVPPGLNLSHGSSKKGHPEIPQNPLQAEPPPGLHLLSNKTCNRFVSTIPGGKVHFFPPQVRVLAKKIFVLETKDNRVIKMLLLLLLAIQFCYEKVILSLPWLHLNPCLDIRVISP